jgi:hypothetical protein
MTPQEEIKRLTDTVKRQKKIIGKLVDALDEATSGQRWSIPWLHKLLKDAQRASGRGTTFGEMERVRNFGASQRARKAK